MRAIIAFAALLLAAEAPADWKFYGTSMLGREELRSFYGDWMVMPNGYLQVSTLDLTAEGLEGAKQNDPGFGRASAKLATGYRPPFAGLHPISSGELADVVEAEEIVRSGAVPPKFQTMREVDCTGRRIRILSLTEDSIEADTAKLNQGWQPVQPGTGNDNLLQLICR